MRRTATPKKAVPTAYRDTPCSVGKTIGDIDWILQRYHAEGIDWASRSSASENFRILRFGVGVLSYRFLVPLTGDPRDERQRMRALYWILKAVFEQAEFGIIRLERLLQAFIEITGADGRITTVGEQIEGELEGRVVPFLLPSGLKALPAPGDGEEA